MQQKDILEELLINKYAMKIADIKTIIFAFRLYRYNLYATIRFINMNFIQKISIGKVVISLSFQELTAKYIKMQQLKYLEIPL